jgi:MFS family permease
VPNYAHSPSSPPALAPLLALAAALSLAAAVSLGITRFAYGLLLPTMRLDLAWGYTLAGGMNTANALGYLLGALATPWLLKHHSPVRLLVTGSLLASVFMAGSGFFVDAPSLLAQRLLAGVASALVFICGGLLAARLGALAPQRMGLLLGVYYGGTGLGITLSALLVPAMLQAARQVTHGWAWSWWALAAACLLATVVLAGVGCRLQALTAPSAAAAQPPSQRSFAWRDFVPGLVGYALFGVGYIGYMTFVVALLREQGATADAVTWFYALLGLAVMASSRIWAGLLDRYKGGQALAILNALLGCATVLPAWTTAWPLVLLSGLLFGGVFLSVVASTTALVRHNLPQSQWAAGISAFTIVFAAGQIIGPTVVGWIADGAGGLVGLQRGLVFSALALWLGAAAATRQRPLGQDA